MPRHRALRTATTIAELLGVEGYSDYAHNQVKSYWRRVVMKGGPRRLRNLEKDFSEFMESASAADKLIVGKFISQRARESFDTGLRIGLMAYAHQRDKHVTFDDESAADKTADKGQG
jgi:predicted DNA-binding ribbon-helix-helix protein